MVALNTGTILVWLTMTLELCQGHDSSHHPSVLDLSDDAEPENPIRKNEFVRDTKHIKQHLQGMIDVDSGEFTPNELDFHFFQLHDANKDNKLDGIELYQSIAHSMDKRYQWPEEGNAMPADFEQKQIASMHSGVTRSVDYLLKQDDKNNDGYINYAEFARSRNVLREAEKIRL